jgi:MOSC domain-containing protein YiiM
MKSAGQATTDSPAWTGELLGIYVAESAGVEMHPLESAELIEGVGIKGDRYANHRGHYSHLWHPDRQVTVIAQEVIDQVSEQIGDVVDPIELRRNVITRGVSLNDLVGDFFSVGEVVLYAGRLNVPCRYLERLIDKPVFDPLVGQSGLNCQIVAGGVIHPGDVIEPMPEGVRESYDGKVQSQ